ncbi:MFS transporter [Paenirhodobacter sp.]|uniref:MFS transporter n=1 Tax=Paenirhodobacter sp. TaxID=1965326 RepID=UPI003B3FB680
MKTPSKRILGWWFFDWASQPFNTLLLTFVFAPYMADLLGSGTTAQTVWGYGIGLAGLVIALGAPFLGAIADRSGRRMPFIVLFSLMYVGGAWALWQAAPGNYSLVLIMTCFAIGLIGMEFATTFTNALLPGLAPREQLGKVSGTGWAFGYVGGLVSLIVMLGFVQINPATGRTLIGLPPLFGLDLAAREDTRIVGPLTAVWYALFMVPFFLWVRDPRPEGSVSVLRAARDAWPTLRATLKGLPKRRSLMLFLIASMLYRDALNGIYTFGGLYAKGVLGWSITQIGLFGILGTITGAVFAWAGGKVDDRLGPKAVIAFCLLVLTAVVVAVAFVSRERVFGQATAPDSLLPDIAFYALGGLIGAAGGALQSASRTMMVRQADPAHMTEAFGLYALTGKATSFVAPLLIGVTTHLSGSQAVGIAPLVVLFLAGLVLLPWVKSSGATRETPA